LALLEAGIKRVVFGARDPGRASGGGSDTLRSGGVEVTGPILELKDARRENPAFFFNQEHGSSYVALKLAQTLDGKIAEAPGHRTAITGSETRHETHRLRAGFDGVMVGVGTVLADNPLLTVREDVPLRKQPARIILDTEARLSPGLRLFDGLPRAPLMIFSADDAPSNRMAALQRAGALVHRVPRGPGGVSLAAVVEVLWKKGIRSVFCEGGGRLASELIRQSMAQRIYLFVAPFVLGGEGLPAFTGLESKESWKGWKPVASPRPFGRDLLLTYDRPD
jgi:diaminohydroxyphosphoribosylaminopyrimidine deaminase/5-amino-6-(5-phosphoribosylamino)uracil reductase